MEPSKAYATDLRNLCQGYALWVPEPGETGEVRVGDVGYIDDQGAFVRLLYVRTGDPDYERNKVTYWRQTLKDFESLSEDIVYAPRTQNPLAAGTYPSHGVEQTSIDAAVQGNAGAGPGGGLSVSYTCKTEHGAILTLNSSTTKESLIDRKDIRAYVLKNHAVWASYASDQLQLAQDAEQIVFVRGWVKTSPDWEAMTFGNIKSKMSVGAEVDSGANASARIVYSKKRVKMPPKAVRRGAAHGKSSSASLPASPPQDQSVFVERYMVKKGWFSKLKVQAAAGYHQLPDQRDGRSGAAGEGVLAMDTAAGEDGSDDGSLQERRVVDPLEILLDYILEKASDAHVAIACDSDLANVLLGQMWPDDLAAKLRELQPQVDVQDNQAMLSFHEKIQRERTHQLSNREITAADRQRFPSIDYKESGRLADGRILLGPSQSSARPMDWRYLKFEHKDMENGAISSVALSLDGELLAAAWDDITVTLWRVKDGLTIQHLEDQGHTDTIWAISFSPDGKYVISGSADTTAIVWDVRNGAMALRLEGHVEDVMAVTYSPDGALIATGSTDCSAKIWDSSNGELLHTFEDLGTDVRRVIFSRDGTRLAACTDTSVTVWDPHAGTQIANLRGHTSAIWCMAFSPGGDRIVTGSEDSSARIWDAGTGEELVTFHEHTSSVWSATFSPDGNEVATASYDGTVVTCDAWSGERRFEFSDNQMSSVVETVAYSPENNFIASGGADGNVRVWNAKTGTFIAEFQGHEEKVKNVTFTPDGWDLVSHADDGTIRAWSVLDALRLC